MIDLFNHLKYDAWIVGNHEFDWGIRNVSLTRCRDRQCQYWLRTQTLDGKPAGASSDSQHPFTRIQPLILKEIAGINLALVG